MSSLFSKIVSGEIQGHKVAETKDYLAFLDIMPVRPGHVLCIPKQEVDYIFDMDDEAYIGLQLFAKHVAKAIKKTVPCTKVAVAVVGLEVPHAHIHLIPINAISELNFQGPQRVKVADDELAKMAEAIRANF